jgi:Rieske 2Fe-2S family protein
MVDAHGFPRLSSKMNTLERGNALPEPVPSPARPAWRGLPGEWYRSEDIYQRELARIWHRAWVFACAECEVGAPGEYVTLTIGSVPILVLRGDDNAVRAFHNLCTHRGTLLCDRPRGTAGKAIMCPYHQWTFTRSGALASCRGMHALDAAELGLRPVAVRTVAGLVFVCLADAPADSGSLERAFASATPHGFADAKVAHAIDYRVAADWKIVWENNRECYHCDAGHPQYVRANFDSAEGERDTPAAREARAAILARGEAFWQAESLSVKYAGGGLFRFPDPDDPDPFPVSANRTVMVEGFHTESMDGQRVGPFMGILRSEQVGVLRLRSVPSFWCHASCDHAVISRVLPGERGVTLVRVLWLVAASARQDVDYSLERLLPFWQLTSEQDWAICERVARGVNSPAFQPGPLSQIREYNVEAFFSWYLSRMEPS